MQERIPTNALPELAELERQRQAARSAEDAAKQHRHVIEQKILAHPALPKLKERGVNNFDVVHISTGETRAYDQRALAEYRAANPQITDDQWPFKTQYIEDATAVRFLHERHPAYMQAIENAALTIKPRKPAFKDGRLPPG